MDPKSEYSKMQLAVALIQLMKTRPYRKIKIKDIVDESGLSYMAYYRNFSSKDQIIVYFLSTVSRKFFLENDIQNVKSKEDFDRYIHNIFDHLVQNKDLSNLLIKNGLFRYIVDVFNQEMEKCVVFKKDKFKAYFLSGGICNIYYYWLSHGGKESSDELTNMFYHSILSENDLQFD